MDIETFEKLMYEEWKRNTLDLYKEETSRPYFDKLWEMRDNLYNIFFPLGISGNGIHDVARVSGELNYTWVDDGELSLVGVYTQEEGASYPEEILELLPREASDRLAASLQEGVFNYFVCRGWHSELTNEYVSKHACYHLQSNRLLRFVACDFSETVFDKLYALQPMFKREKEACEASDVDDDAYYDVRMEIKKLVQQIIEESK